MSILMDRLIVYPPLAMKARGVKKCRRKERKAFLISFVLKRLSAVCKRRINLSEILTITLYTVNRNLRIAPDFFLSFISHI